MTLHACACDNVHVMLFILQLSMLGLVWPSLLLTYLGQAAYLIKYPDTFSAAYYAAIPHSVFWPMFVLAVLAAIIASQVHCRQRQHQHLRLTMFAILASHCVLMLARYGNLHSRCDHFQGLLSLVVQLKSCSAEELSNIWCSRAMLLSDFLTMNTTGLLLNDCAAGPHLSGIQHRVLGYLSGLLSPLPC